MSKGASISSSRYPRQLSSSSGSGSEEEEGEDDAYAEDSFESAGANSPAARKQQAIKGGVAVAQGSSLSLADYVTDSKQGAPGADVIATITRGLEGVSPKKARETDASQGGGDDGSGRSNYDRQGDKHRSKGVSYDDILDDDDNAILKKFNIVLSPRQAEPAEEEQELPRALVRDSRNDGNRSDRKKESNRSSSGRAAAVAMADRASAMAPSSPISTTRTRRPPSQEMSPEIAATIASVRGADAAYKSKKHSKAAPAPVAASVDETGGGRRGRDRGQQQQQRAAEDQRRAGDREVANDYDDGGNSDDHDEGSGSDGNSGIDDIVKMARRKKTERGYGEDPEFKILQLKRKLDSYREKLRHETDVKDRLTGVCNALRDDLIIARQRIQELEDELAAAQRRAKASGKAQAAKKANRAAAEENEALRSIIAEMQEADGAAREQIEALAAVNAELNIQLKQSASREIEWRTAHQELSDRVLRQFSQRILKDVISMSQLRAAASGEYPAIPGPPALATSASAPSTLRGKGPEDSSGPRPDFRLDNVRMEKETLSKPAKQRGFPPI